jgi:ATP-dependent DNA ligase
MATRVIVETLRFRPMPAASIPFPPMEAQLVRQLPENDGWQYEPKWDGFRGVLENVEGELHLWSRNERPLLRYFPELRPLGELLEPGSALDGEIVIARDGALDFDAMQTRLHPAESRVRKLSAEIPAEFVAFDVLLWGGEEVWRQPLSERRSRVEGLEGFRRSPATGEIAEARGWLERFETLGLDGVVAKRLDAPYLPGSRDGMVKVKEHKSADCVVVGLRWKAGSDREIATLLLGLYGDDGEIDYVGTCAVAAKTREDVAERVLPLLVDAPDRRFSEPNRWGTGELEQASLRPELVVEVRYDKVQGTRFRHGSKLLRWRDDKDPQDCTWRELRPPRDPAAPGIDSLLT